MNEDILHYKSVCDQSKPKQQGYRSRENKMKRNFRFTPKLFKSKKILFICKILVLITIFFLQLSANLPRFRKLYHLKCTHWSDVACTILLWKGDELAYLPNEETIEATVVVSHCDEDMSSLTNYIDDKSANINVINIILISSCGVPFPKNLQITGHNELTYNVTTVQSKWKQPELKFIAWLIDYLESAQSKSLPQYYFQDNHVLLFLRSDPIKNKGTTVRTMDQVVQAAMEKGFGCLLRPLDKLSYYHDALQLKTYQNPELGMTRQYDNLGEWTDHLNSSGVFPRTVPLVPVCYGSSFAIKSKDISQDPAHFDNVLKAIKADYEKLEYSELIEFMERSFAALFSHPLSEHEIQSLRKYSTNMYWGPHYTGSLTHRWEIHNWTGVFSGDTIEKQDVDLSEIRLTLVISYCDEDMSWMEEYFKDLNITNTTIISKCIDKIEGYNPPGANIIRQPNVGGCGHSYASWMAKLEEKDTDNHIVLFFKDSLALYEEGMRSRPMQDLIRIAMERGFACEAAAFDKSIFYRTGLIRLFEMAEYQGVNIKSSYVNMGSWLDTMGINLMFPITPVCFGNFATKASQIYSKKDLWEKIEISLTRGENNEEEHFAERAWAGILSNPLNSNETAVMQSIPVLLGESEGLHGGQIRINDYEEIYRYKPDKTLYEELLFG